MGLQSWRVTKGEWLKVLSSQDLHKMDITYFMCCCQKCPPCPRSLPSVTITLQPPVEHLPTRLFTVIGVVFGDVTAEVQLHS